MISKCSLLLVSLVATAGTAKFPTNPSAYAMCRYYYVTDEMNCVMTSGEEHTWANKSPLANPRARERWFKKDAVDRCWLLPGGNKIDGSILFEPLDCTGD